MILLFGHRRGADPDVDLDEVDPQPILDMDEMPSYYCILGRDSRGRRIFRSRYADGRIGYFYFDREVSEARRLGKTTLRETTEHRRPDGESPLALGWKGFDADSSPWEILGVARDSSIKEIKAAYRRLITKFHPDRYQNLSSDEIADLERDTKLIHAAYAKLAKS
ncbi:J domain-containing protein [Tautonia plasticadhaerens]|nr:DnaJ domain-containing protein [Tautonia plasticadhaerens]